MSLFSSKYLRPFSPIARSFFFILILFTLCACGGGKEIPSWTVAGYNYLEGFKRSYLAGNENHAEVYFRRAIEEIKRSGDLEALARAYLIRMALQRAVLVKVETGEFLKLDELSPNEWNKSYFHFLLCEMDKVKPAFLPEQYGTLFEALLKDDVASVVQKVSSIDNPLSRLVACGIAIGRGVVSEELLRIAIDTSSHMGWKRALVSYMKLMVDFCEERGKRAQADNLRARLRVIEE